MVAERLTILNILSLTMLLRGREVLLSPFNSWELRHRETAIQETGGGAKN